MNKSHRYFRRVKIAGQRAYDLMRAGQKIELSSRKISIYRFELIAIPNPDEMVFEVECGKGTYVRSLARDIGRQLGCYGHISALRRAMVGPL